MNKILLFCLMVGLGGCAENNTGLQKNVINTGFEACNKYLTSSLKSPSSLRIKEVAINIKKPSVNDVYDVFGNLILSDGKVNNTTKESKARFREMLVAIRYEAQNSFGVYLGGLYQCQYLYKLENDDRSPKSLDTYLFNIKSDGEDAGLGVSIPIAEFTGSNISLDSQIKTVINASESKFNPNDEQMYSNLIKRFKTEKQKTPTNEVEDELSRAVREATEAASDLGN